MPLLSLNWLKLVVTGRGGMLGNTIGLSIFGNAIT